jgi:predicted MFS family arabinose efflux permease
MIGRAFVGVAIGGFWSMSAATVMRLVPEEAVPKGLAILNGGGAIATTLGAPLGSFLGGLIGWRGAFFCVVPIAVMTVIWEAIALPNMRVAPARKGGSILGLLRRPPVIAGMVAVALLFAGQYALYTYLRPFLEQVTHVGVEGLSALLLVVGVAGFIGTALIARVVDHRLQVTLAMTPAIMALLAAGLAVLGGSTWMAAVLLALWGFVGTAAPVAWWTWLTRTAPHDAEAGGGLMVAVVQLAITLGATAGGAAYDAMGAAPEFLGCAGILAAAALAALFAGTVHVRMTA